MSEPKVKTLYSTYEDKLYIVVVLGLVSLFEVDLFSLYRNLSLTFVLIYGVSFVSDLRPTLISAQRKRCDLVSISRQVKWFVRYTIGCSPLWDVERVGLRGEDLLDLYF